MTEKRAPYIVGGSEAEEFKVGRWFTFRRENGQVTLYNTGLAMITLTAEQEQLLADFLLRRRSHQDNDEVEPSGDDESDDQGAEATFLYRNQRNR